MRIVKFVMVLFLSFVILNCEQNLELVKAKVLQVYDGDTIKILLDGKEESVRYIGIDTPETNHPKRPVEEYGKEASKENARMIEDSVYIEFDVQKRDKYDRLLAYVYNKNKEMINLHLARNGFASLLTFPPNIKYNKKFYEAAEYARENNLGLWNEFEKISLEDANNKIGEWVEVEFKVFSVYEAEKLTFINSSADRKTDFTAIIFKNQRDKFPDVTSWKDKTITLKGKLIEYDGPEIIINETWQVEMNK